MSIVDFRDGSLVGKFGRIVGARTIAGLRVRGFTPRGVGPSVGQEAVQTGIGALASISRGLKLFADARDFYSAGPGCSLMANLTAYNAGNVPAATLAPSTVFFSKGARCPISSSGANATVVGGDIAIPFTHPAWFMNTDRVRLRGFLLDRVTGETWQEGRCAVGFDVLSFSYVHGMPDTARLVVVGLDSNGKPWEQYQADVIIVPAAVRASAIAWAATVRAYPGSANFYSMLSESDSVEEALEYYIDTGSDTVLDLWEYFNWINSKYSIRGWADNWAGAGSPWTWTITQTSGAALSEAEFARLGFGEVKDGDPYGVVAGATINAPARQVTFTTTEDPDMTTPFWFVVVRDVAGHIVDGYAPYV